ncbi:efflux RND transporter periplasmic adaptor subunit [Pseudomonas sp. REB1044]|uniref:efflux RND transporter periplasmic adaptor subunit n=1 Tax=Pseudomonas sp. REB1044 TaxID=2675224 RepID=UPI00315CF210
MNRSQKIALSSIVALGVIAVALKLTIPNGLFGAGDSTPALIAPLKVAVAPATREQRFVQRRGIGEIEAAQQVLITAETGGKVTRILFKAGDAVKKGDLLIQLNDAPEQGQLASLQARLPNAKNRYDRAVRLQALSASTVEDLEQKKAEYQQLQGDIRNIQASIDQKQIRAPFDGQLGVRRVNLGEYVGSGAPIVSLVNPNTMYANLIMPEAVLADLTVGQQVAVRSDAYPGKIFNGVLTTVESMIDPQTRTIKVQATFDNSDRALRPGLYVNGVITKAQRYSVITAPDTAIGYSSYGDYVFVVDRSQTPPQVRKVSGVKVGEHFDGKVELLDGIEEGQELVTSGQLRLYDKAKVEVLPSDIVSIAQSDAKRSLQ